MAYKLIEFANPKSSILRAILQKPKKSRDVGVIFLHGLEKTTLTGTKFKYLADELFKNDILTFRFDFTGSGLSDGDFAPMTVASQLEDLYKAIATYKKESGLKKFHLVGHSLAGCVIAKYLEQTPKFKEKIILLSPAIDQAALLRFWYVKNYYKLNNPSINITWQNYSHYLDEADFNRDCQRATRIWGTRYINKDYFIENMNLDYSPLVEPYDKNILLIQGESDDKVPLESRTAEFTHKVIVKGGDHDLERPDLISQWLPKAVEFLAE